MVNESLKSRFFNLLKEQGGSAGNASLREALSWDEVKYEEVKGALIEQGLIVSGRGRGGSVRLAEFAGKQGEVEAIEPTPSRPAKNARTNGNGGNLGFEAELFKAADKLRGNMEPSDYKHVALGLIFLKHISDTFEAKRAELLEDDKAFPEDEATTEQERIANRLFLLGRVHPMLSIRVLIIQWLCPASKTARPLQQPALIRRTAGDRRSFQRRLLRRLNFWTAPVAAPSRRKTNCAFLEKLIAPRASPERLA
jgi:hypothetical protein